MRGIKTVTVIDDGGCGRGDRIRKKRRKGEGGESLSQSKRPNRFKERKGGAEVPSFLKVGGQTRPKKGNPLGIDPGRDQGESREGRRMSAGPQEKAGTTTLFFWKGECGEKLGNQE